MILRCGARNVPPSASCGRMAYTTPRPKARRSHCRHCGAVELPSGERATYCSITPEKVEIGCLACGHFVAVERVSGPAVAEGRAA